MPAIDLRRPRPRHEPRHDAGGLVAAGGSDHDRLAPGFQRSRVEDVDPALRRPCEQGPLRGELGVDHLLTRGERATRDLVERGAVPHGHHVVAGLDRHERAVRAPRTVEPAREVLEHVDGRRLQPGGDVLDDELRVRAAARPEDAPPVRRVLHETLDGRLPADGRQEAALPTEVPGEQHPVEGGGVQRAARGVEGRPPPTVVLDEELDRLRTADVPDHEGVARGRHLRAVGREADAVHTPGHGNDGPHRRPSRSRRTRAVPLQPPRGWSRRARARRRRR